MATNFTLIDQEMDWNHLHRFLLIGNEAGLCITPPPDLATVATPALDRCLRANGAQVVHVAAHALMSGCGHRPEPALWALARALTIGDPVTRQDALEVLPVAVRSGAQLFQLLNYLPPPTSWDGRLRRALGEWYSRRTPVELVTLVLQSPKHMAWKHHEILAAVKPSARTRGHAGVYHWIRYNSLEALSVDDASFELLCALRLLQHANSEAVVAAVLQRWPILTPDLPAEWLRSPRVWRQVVASLSAEDLLRWMPWFAASNVGQVGEAAADLFQAFQISGLSRAPRSALSALEALGRVRTSEGRPAQDAPTALESALFDLFHDWMRTTRLSTGTLVIAIDPSAGAERTMPGLPGISAREAFAALALLAAAGAREVYLLKPERTLVPVPFARRERLDTLVSHLAAASPATAPFSGAAPIQWALRQEVQADAFLVLNATAFSHGPESPELSLAHYREATGIPARWIGVNVGAALMGRSAPSDPSMMETLGLDTSLMALILGLLHDME